MVSQYGQQTHPIPVVMSLNGLQVRVIFTSPWTQQESPLMETNQELIFIGFSAVSQMNRQMELRVPV